MIDWHFEADLSWSLGGGEALKADYHGKIATVQGELKRKIRVWR